MADLRHGRARLRLRHLRDPDGPAGRRPAIASSPASSRGRRTSITGSGCSSGSRPLVGGAFGLLGGYLTDRFGRRRVLVWSILIYAFSAMPRPAFDEHRHAAGPALARPSSACSSSSWRRWRGWRRLFPDPKQREKALGYTQAFSSMGGLLVTGAYYIAVTYGPSFPAIRGRPRALALHADLRRDSALAADPDPAVPAGIAGLAAEERRRARCGARRSPNSSRRNCAARRSSRR